MTLIGDAALPDFENPPIVEAVASVEFESFQLTTLGLGALVSRWSGDYPEVSEHEIIPPTTAFGPATAPFQFTFGIGAPTPSIRFWAASHDEQWLAQLQNDRVVLNWRRRNGEQQYPQFSPLQQRLNALLDDLVAFIVSQGRAEPTPLIAEYTYVNHIEPAAADYLYSIVTAPQRPLPGTELYTGFRLVRDVPSNSGRSELTITAEPIPLDPGQSNTAGHAAVALNVTTRVFLGANSSLSTAKEAIDFAHQISRAGFTAVTSREIQDRWGRTEG